SISRTCTDRCEKPVTLICAHTALPGSRRRVGGHPREDRCSCDPSFSNSTSGIVYPGLRTQAMLRCSKTPEYQDLICSPRSDREAVGQLGPVAVRLAEQHLRCPGPAEIQVRRVFPGKANATVQM